MNYLGAIPDNPARVAAPGELPGDPEYALSTAARRFTPDEIAELEADSINDGEDVHGRE